MGVTGGAEPLVDLAVALDGPGEALAVEDEGVGSRSRPSTGRGAGAVSLTRLAATASGSAGPLVFSKSAISSPR